ncbi:hypothetical protein PENTCL1PPCAC_8563, partial [Pristionchus entomophagus]
KNATLQFEKDHVLPDTTYLYMSEDGTPYYHKDTTRNPSLHTVWNGVPIEMQLPKGRIDIDSMTPYGDKTSIYFSSHKEKKIYRVEFN